MPRCTKSAIVQISAEGVHHTLPSDDVFLKDGGAFLAVALDRALGKGGVNIEDEAVDFDFAALRHEIEGLATTVHGGSTLDGSETKHRDAALNELEVSAAVMVGGGSTR